MLILTLIGLLIAAFAIYTFILWFNKYTYHHAQYEFFTREHSVSMVFSYALMFFGNSWMQTALKNNDDWLNGAIVLAVGVALLLGVIVNNFKQAPRLYAIAGSLAQMVFYIPITIGAVIIVAVMVAWFSETKPVYNINGRD
ncbi:MAG: hypothetical protein Q8R86_09385 [Sulfuricurvum sp.]|nr:hypothetical protein [Sulfuricurvum sp.]